MRRKDLKLIGVITAGLYLGAVIHFDIFILKRAFCLGGLYAAGGIAAVVVAAQGVALAFVEGIDQDRPALTPKERRIHAAVIVAGMAIGFLAWAVMTVKLKISY